MPLSFLEAHYYLEALLLDRNQPSFILDFFWFLVRAYVTTTVRAGVMEIGEIGHEMAYFGMKIIVDRHGDSRIRFRKSTRSRSKNPHVRSISSSRDRHCRGVCGDFLSRLTLYTEFVLIRRNYFLGLVPRTFVPRMVIISHEVDIWILY